MCAKTKKINHGFKCIKCGQYVPPATKTCRNHCIYCLYSQHVDEEIPGDRNSKCKGLMEPIKIKKTAKGYTVIHRCIKCGYINCNRSLEDDSLDKVIELFHLSQ